METFDTIENWCSILIIIIWELGGKKISTLGNKSNNDQFQTMFVTTETESCLIAKRTEFARITYFINILNIAKHFTD